MTDSRELLRFITAGSVDDGKSTLIGRLLYDAHAIYQDQLDMSIASNGRSVDFSLLTDGLRAEREQGITIDLAYRYFATARRQFIVADVPGHEQYTRNMATGASTASLAVLLLDAQKGARRQTHRHAAIAWLMGIRNFVVAVNKMDLLGFEEEAFRRIELEFSGFLKRLGAGTFYFVPCCAPEGDNLVRRSTRTPWYRGLTLIECLEAAPVALQEELRPLRLPVQAILRSPSGERHCAGRIASGVVKTGDTILALPSGSVARVACLCVAGRAAESATPPLSASIVLDRALDIGRGDMLVDPERPPVMSRSFAATLLWLSQVPLALGRAYLFKHTSQYVCGIVTQLAGAIDPVTLERRPSAGLSINEFGEAELETHQPLFIDRYSENPITGAFIVVDPISNETVAAGMISRCGPSGDEVQQPRLPNSGTGLAVWFTGLSSAGKSTISKAVYEKLWAKGYKVEMLDGDIMRRHLNKDLGFSKEDRDENIRRIGFVAELLVRNGVVVLVAAISPYRSVRDEIRARVGNFLEVYVNAPLEIVEARDLKGIYRRYRAGELRDVTGMDAPYEPPLAPEVECCTGFESLAESVAKVTSAIESRIDPR